VASRSGTGTGAIVREYASARYGRGRAPNPDPAGLTYFQTRVSRAQRDVQFALAVTLEGRDTRASQERALEILQFKLCIGGVREDQPDLRQSRSSRASMEIRRNASG
jgi:hypothetical protein